MNVVQKTLSQCLDDAVATMPLFRRAVWQSRLMWPGFRRRTLQELQERLHDDERSESLSFDDGTAFARMLADDNFTADTPFAIDIDKLRELLKLILEFLPLILKLFTGFGVLLLVLVLLPTNADAQWLRRGRVVQSYSNCPSGQCPTQSIGRWKNYDGMSFREHARVKHGINTAGMTDFQVAQLRDRDHDMYGGGHPAILHSLPDRSLRVVNQSPSIKPAIRPLAKPSKVASHVPIEARSFLPIEAHYQGS